MSVTPLEIQANRLDLLSRLAGDISHEIKNPLHAMVINLELVRRRVEKGEREGALERVAIVEQEVAKVHGLTHALIEALRPPREVDTVSVPARVVEEIVPLLAARARLARVDFSAEPGADAVRVDLSPHLLRQALLNLFDRGVRAAGVGGTVRLELDFDERMVSITIADSGVAPEPYLPEAEQEPVGLRFAHALAVTAGGEVIVQSGEEPLRARVILRLPRTGSA